MSDSLLNVIAVLVIVICPLLLVLLWRWYRTSPMTLAGRNYLYRQSQEASTRGTELYEELRKKF